MTIREIDIRIRADINEIPKLVATLEHFAAMSNVPDEALFKIQLALDELINNVIDHNKETKPASEISIRITHYGDSIGIVMRDDATLFDPFSVPTPSLYAAIDERPLGGLGVHLIRSLLSETSYCVDEGRNRVQLTLIL